jgi:uncharacterized protein YndB with AHSA1/START domain
MEREIRHQFFLPSPPEVVWDYLTKPELLAQWLMESNIQPLPGYKFQFKTKPRIKSGFDGTVYCEILEIVPYKRLSYSWKGGPGPGKITLDSVVIWTLTRNKDGTDLFLQHKGFKGLKNYFTYIIMNMGWSKIGKRLAEHVKNYKHATTEA